MYVLDREFALLLNHIYDSRLLKLHSSSTPSLRALTLQLRAAVSEAPGDELIFEVVEVGVDTPLLILHLSNIFTWIRKHLGHFAYIPLILRFFPLFCHWNVVSQPYPLFLPFDLISS